MLAICAYSMHMWELYACWSWFRRFTSASLIARHGYTSAEASAAAGLITFFVVASGAVGCVLGGVCGDRLALTLSPLLAVACAPSSHGVHCSNYV